MVFIKALLKIVWLMSLACLLFLFFLKPPIPTSDKILDIVKSHEPKQTEIEPVIIEHKYGGFDYQVEHKYEYDIYGLVVSKYDSDIWFDFYHKRDPANTTDLCLIWGENVDSVSYKDVHYSSGEFTCTYFWSHTMNPPFSNSHLSNNHLVPKDEALARTAKSVWIGDQVHVKGYLSTYKVYKDGKQVSSRGTSTVRNDSGNGACETIYIESIEIVKRGNPLLFDAKRYSPWALLISTLLLAFIFYAEMKRGVV
jgi:hypothetical protein